MINYYMTNEIAKERWAQMQEDHEHGVLRIAPVVCRDMAMMHGFYGIHDAMKKLSLEQLKEFISFRFRFLQEEVTEGFKAIEEKDGDGVIDSIIDLIVVAVGTLDLMDVDFTDAWNEVLRANMNKKVGIKASRPNALGLPDLIKPENWQAPDHSDNLGDFQRALDS